jgi:hypothetical protein|tara:strand:+ start:1742 stop:1885 length:144 start_codon:yes stop_codon:yes gene_type:complete
MLFCYVVSFVDRLKKIETLRDFGSNCVERRISGGGIIVVTKGCEGLK